MNVTAIGRTRILYETIRTVERAGHPVERIVTFEGSDFYEVTIQDFSDLADEIGADFRVPDDVNAPDLGSTFRESESEIAISINCPIVIECPVLDAFDDGVINGHAGDLPRYRGNAAPNWAIINGEDEVVLTVHSMTEELDAGPIHAQHSVPLDDSTYIGDVYDAMNERFPELFAQVVDDAATGSLDPRPQSQDPEDVLRGYPRKPVDSQLQWDKPADHLARIVRASSEPLFGAYTWLDRTKLRVWRARAEQPSHDYLGSSGQVAERRLEEGEVAIITGEGFLILESVQREGVDQKRRPATEIIGSIRTRLGLDTASVITDLQQEVTDLRRRLNESGNQS